LNLTPSRLDDGHKKLILDASILINILGTGLSEVVLKGLNRKVMVDEVALREVTIDPFSRKDPAEVLFGLRKNGLIEVISMESEAYDLFIGLTGGDPPDDLDDGEAATLAQAAFGNYVAVIDERKATRIAGLHFPGVALLNSLDLLTSRDLLLQNGRDAIADVVYLALRYARMRVAPSERQWIFDLLGDDRARECPSLGFRGLTV
jgi:hypothetical protein